MAIHGSSRGRGRLWLVLLVVLSAALVSLLALLQWDSPVRANEQKASGHQITLERSGGADFQRKLSEAINQNDVETQIAGGTAVPDGKYRFMAILVIGETNGGIGLCGGSLIDSNSVLTAAHCLVNAVSVDLAVGRTVISQNQGQVRFATTAFIHPRFNLSNNFSNDAAVLQLNRAVTGIKPIKLATARQNYLERPRRSLTTAGWGTTSEGGSGTDRMREVSVPVVSDAKAQTAYGSDAYFPSLMLAAGVKGKDTCQGDSGGPLFNPGTTRTQVGITSFGRGCGRAGFPGVYTEVNNPSIRSFITRAAGNRKTRPAAPSNLSVAAVNSSTIRLRWQDNSN